MVLKKIPCSLALQELLNQCMDYNEGLDNLKYMDDDMEEYNGILNELFGLNKLSIFNRRKNALQKRGVILYFLQNS